MNRNSHYSLLQFLQFFIFVLFLAEMILWDPNSDNPSTIILKLLNKIVITFSGEDNSETVKWIYPIVIAGLFSISFPEIFLLISKSLKTILLKRKLVDKYIKTLNRLPLLWPMIGSVLAVTALVFLNESLTGSKDIIEYLMKIRQSKPLQIIIYILLPITIILIWIHNLFINASNGNSNELIIIVGKKPENKNYVISGPMASIEMAQLLGDNEKNFDWISIQKFPEPVTVPLKLGNVETNFSLSIMLGAIVKEEIKNDEDAWWLYNAFRDLKNKTNTPDLRDCILITYITDEIEQAIVRAKTNLASDISSMVGYSSDLQVNSIIMDLYGPYIDHLQEIVNRRLDYILGSGTRILRIEFLSKKMIVTNADDRIQEDFEAYRESSKEGWDIDNESRPKIFNLTSQQRKSLLESVDKNVFKDSQARLRQRLLNIPKQEETLV